MASIEERGQGGGENKPLRQMARWCGPEATLEVCEVSGWDTHLPWGRKLEGGSCNRRKP